MKSLRRFFRIIHINFVLAKHGLDQIVLSIPLFAPIQFLAFINPLNWRSRDHKPRGQRIREALIELGPIFVKFGQMLSTRSDLLPDDIAFELAKLQDQVPPFSSAKAKAIVEKAYGARVEEVFAYFNPVPLASASIAQIHTIQLIEGEEAVIKIVRPGIQKLIRRDVDLLYTLARLAERFWTRGIHLRLVEVVAEFERIIFAELDLMREAANASQLKRNFSDGKILYIPEIFWPYVRENVMVMERIYGVPISDVATLKSLNINLKKLAETGVTIFFMQVFRDCFFHADMHPGNIFVDPNSQQMPRYMAVDFGIMGTLSPNDQRYLAENFLAFFKRDYRRVAELHIESGWVPADTRLEELEAAVRTVGEPMFDRPLKDISFGRTLMRLLQAGRRFNMEVQPQLFLLQKTLLNVEGLGRQLYPELDLWSTAKPFFEDWIENQINISNLLEKTWQTLPYWLDKVPTFPLLVNDTLIALKHSHQSTQDEKKKDLLQSKKLRRRSFLQGIGFAFLFLTIITLLAESNTQDHMFTIEFFAFLSMSLFAFLLASFNKLD